MFELTSIRLPASMFAGDIGAKTEQPRVEAAGPVSVKSGPAPSGACCGAFPAQEDG